MFRFKNHRLIRLYTNGIQSLLMQTKYQANVNSFAISSFTTQSDTFDVSKAANIAKNIDISREKRLNLIKRNSVSGEHDVLSESIIKSDSIDHLKELISLHVDVMNNRHLSDVFESIHDILRKSDDCDRDSQNLLSSQEFNRLCNQTVKRMRFFQIQDILTSLKTLVFLSLSPNTTIIQSLLQMIRQNINDFSINEIIFLDFLLNKQMIDKRIESEEHNYEIQSLDDQRPQGRAIIVPLVEALKLAIPLVLQLKIEGKELNFDDIELVIKCLRMAAKHNLRDEVVNQLTAAVSYKIPELTVSQLYSVIASLITFPNTNTNINTNLVNRVVNQSLDRVTATGVTLPSSAHNFVLSLLLNHKTRRNFYHKGLFEMCANLIAQNPNKFHNSKITGTLFALSRQSHVHFGLLDLITDKIVVRESDLIDNPKNSFTNILQAFALPSNYRPNAPNSEVVFKNILDSNHIKLCKQQKTKHLLFRILRHFSVLNYYPKQEMRDWIKTYLESALTASTLMGLRIEFLENIQYIYQGLCLESNITDSEDLKQIMKPLVNEFNAFCLKEVNESPKSSSLGFALSQGLGGPQFVATNMLTDFGHIVDYVIVLRRGGYPIPINNEDNKCAYISQLEVPNDSKTIGITLLTQRDYCREPLVRRGETEFRLRTLRKLGINIIGINLEGWESLAEIEKIPFIMREIQENSDLKETETN